MHLEFKSWFPWFSSSNCRFWVSIGQWISTILQILQARSAAYLILLVVDLCVVVYWITLWLFNIAMENCPFIDDSPIETSIYYGFSMAMLNNQRVYRPGPSFVAQFLGTWNFRYVSTNLCATLKFQDVCAEKVRILVPNIAQHLQIQRIWHFCCTFLPRILHSNFCAAIAELTWASKKVCKLL